MSTRSYTPWWNEPRHKNYTGYDRDIALVITTLTLSVNCSWVRAALDRSRYGRSIKKKRRRVFPYDVWVLSPSLFASDPFVNVRNYEDIDDIDGDEYDQFCGRLRDRCQSFKESRQEPNFSPIWSRTTIWSKSTAILLLQCRVPSLSQPTGSSAACWNRLKEKGSNVMKHHVDGKRSTCHSKSDSYLGKLGGVVKGHASCRWSTLQWWLSGNLWEYSYGYYRNKRAASSPPPWLHRLPCPLWVTIIMQLIG